MIDESLVARIYTQDNKNIDRVGTGYPIAPNLLLTALHVVSYPEKKQSEGIEIVWGECDLASETLSEDAIVYRGDEHGGYDLALVRCKTPLKQTLILEAVPPKPHTAFYCFGYPLAGLHKKKPQHDKLTFSGATDGNSQGFQLELTANDVVQTIEDESLAIENWGGLSGSPVVTNQKIVGVVAIKYATVEKKLFAVSLPYLLKNCPEFQKIFLPDAQATHAYFIQSQQTHIRVLLAEINQNAALYQRLTALLGYGDRLVDSTQLSEALFSKVKDDPLSFLQHFREQVITPLLLSSQNTDLLTAKALYLLFLGLLLTADHFEYIGHLHDLQVKTRMAAEIQLAARYNKPVKLCPNPHADIGNRDGVIGVHAIDGEGLVIETGWEVGKTAESIATVVEKSIYKTHKKVHNHNNNEPQPELDEFDIEDLNETLRLRRELPENPELIRLEIGSSEILKKEHPLHDDEVCTEIQKALSNLIIARYGQGVMNKEAKLLAEIREFFNLTES